MPIHNLSGFLPAIHVFGVMIPIYFLDISIAFIVAMVWLVRRADRSGLSRNRALDAALVLMIAGFVGSRLFHVFVEEPAYYAARPSLVFDIWSGGFVWYGGALVGAASAVLFLYLKREPLGIWLDLFAPVCALGYAVGRVACVMAGCCYGRVTQLPAFLGGELVRHPTQTYAVLSELVTLSILLHFERRRREGRAPLFLRADGQIFFAWLCLHAIGRIFMEQFRDDPRGPDLLGFSVSTWLSAALLISSIAVLFMRSRRPRQRPGI